MNQPLFGQVELQQEVEAVEQTLATALEELHGIFGEMVRSELAQLFSPVRVGGILSAGYRQPDSPSQREQRILLAAAVEMLHLALQLHQRLVGQGRDFQPQAEEKSWVGSIILAGDYCFSRSAILAAQTDEPQVVAIFSQALKQISEGHLRHLFQPDEGRFAEAEVLVQAGLSAAALLAGLSPVERSAVMGTGLSLILTGDGELGDLPTLQQSRWRAVQQASA
jgi:geranylgeranyl pyrophosphate synthase